MSPDKPPPPRPGYVWVWRKGCQCKACPWKGSCIGETWPHWREVAKAGGKE